MHVLIATNMYILSFDNIHRDQGPGQRGAMGEGFVELERPGHRHAKDEAVLRAACAIGSDGIAIMIVMVTLACLG